MAFETRLTSTDQEQPYLRVPSREGSEVPGSCPSPYPGQQCRVLSRGVLPLAPPPGQHSEYSSVEFSHLAGGGLGHRGSIIQCLRLRGEHEGCVFR